MLIFPSLPVQYKTFYCYLHTLNTQSMSHSMYLYHSVSLSPSSKSVPSPSSHSLLTFHYISAAVPSTALDIHTYLLTYLLTPQSTVLLEKLTSFELVKKFPTFYGIQRFITTPTSACQLYLSSASSIQSIPPHPTS